MRGRIHCPYEVNYLVSPFVCWSFLQSNRGEMSVFKCDCKPRKAGEGTQQQVKTSRAAFNSLFEIRLVFNLIVCVGNSFSKAPFCGL